VQRPNRPMSGLEKFGLDTVSPSTINDWISYRPKFVIRKIYGYRDLPTSCAIERGNQSEYAVKLILQDKVDTDEAIERALKNFDNVCNPDMKDYDLEKKCIPAIVMGSVKEISSNFGEIISFQQEIKGELGGYTYRGFTDFVLKDDKGNKCIVDLKTAKRKPYKLSSSHARQISLYSHALDCEAQLLYVVPHKQTDRKTKIVSVKSTEAIWWSITEKDKRSYLEECEEVLRVMDMVLYNCNDKKEVAEICYPNIDDFYWDSPQILKIRKEIWNV
jgi:hypothetical protein